MKFTWIRDVCVKMLQNWLGVGAKSPKDNSKKRKLDFSEDESTPKKFVKNFNQKSYDWYVCDDAGLWHCTVCRTAKVENAYAHGHNKAAKTTNHERHQNSGQHKFALTKKVEGKTEPMKQHIDTSILKEDKQIFTYLKCAYYLAKEELPKDKFESILKLTHSLNSELITDSDGNIKYCSHAAITEFQNSIGDVIVEDKINKIISSDYFSLTVDESTDIGNKKRLLMYVSFLDNHRVKTEFFDNVQITTASANAETITAKIVNSLCEKGIDISKMVAIGTDGASVMTGRKSGVVVRLMKDSPSLIGIHCAAHRCSLATSQAAKSISELSKFSQITGSIFHYFSNSALRQNKLTEIQHLLNLPELKYAEVHSVRWLSLDRAVEVLYRTYPALVLTLEHEASTNPTAKGLLHEVRQYTFIAIMHMLMDILPFISRLSKVFQTESMDFSCIQPMVSTTIDSLNEMKENTGVYVDKLEDYIREEDGAIKYKRPQSESLKKSVNQSKSLNVDGFLGCEGEHYEGEFVNNLCFELDMESNVQEVDVKMYPQQKNILNRILPDYVSKIEENLSSRFSDCELVSNMHVLTPECICNAKKSMTSQEFSKYGKKEVAQLSEHFAEHHDLASDSILSEYVTYRGLVAGSYQDKSFSCCAQDILMKYASSIPNLCKLLKIALLLPISSVPCERGFSTQNRILSKFRTSISNTTLNYLMHISEDGPALEEFDFSRALLKWRKKPRRM